ncbi:hypothetical protein [Aquabacterium sp.]|uniref:hypothetical protein n=1 Tax=Aquabacterium sp. TaxID=1872578 RepID=UPI0040383D16
MNTDRVLAVAALVLAALVGCTIPVGHNAALDQARNEYRVAQRNPLIVERPADGARHGDHHRGCLV